jgi:glycosyltransferase involved in cell wall biosynthesis
MQRVKPAAEPVRECRVALFMPSLAGGGAERVMVTLANAFAAHRLGVDLVLADARGALRDSVAPAVRVVDLGAGRVARSLAPLARYLRRERPRAMLSFLNHANVVAILARRLAAVPVRLVISERNHPSADAALSGPRAGLLLALMRLTYPWADRIVAVSHGVAEDLTARLRLPAGHVVTIRNPIVAPHLTALADAPLNHPWMVPGAPPVILGVGRLSPQKDFATLIRAFGAVRARRPARLVILGEGEQRAALDSLIAAEGLAADVALPGYEPNPLRYMRRAAMLALSSRHEGLPGALIEAMACGTPVVATDCPSGPAEILENGRWGRLVPVGDADAVAAAIEATLDDPAPPAVAERAKAFGVEAAISAYLEVLSLDAAPAAAERRAGACHASTSAIDA